VVATEAEVPAYQGTPIAADQFGAISGNVFEPRKTSKRAASISNIDEVSKKAAARYVTRMEGYDSLKQLPIFAELSLDEMKDVYHLGMHMDFSPGSVLIEQGRAGEALFIIRKGRVKICVLESGVEKEVAQMTGGSYVGEMALIDEAPTSARVVAQELTRVFVLRRDALTTYLYRHDHVALRIYKSFAKTLAERLRIATKQVAN
jgi:signal-transduction protein with cAMP-binding, CBS, and nucleotidyltransferase domain